MSVGPSTVGLCYVRPCRRLDHGESTRLGKVRPHLDSWDADVVY